MNSDHIPKCCYRNPKKYVPKGFYCYNIVDGTHIIPCVFWDMDKTKRYQENGYCHLLKRGDWDMDGLLWDQCKECNINTEILDKYLNL